MQPLDTSAEVQKKLDEHYRRMTPIEKADFLRSAWSSARAMALAGLRLDYPDESEAKLEARWASRRLGPELYAKVMDRT